MLEIDGVNAYYKDLQALWGISLKVKQGELVALVGPNGAGKTTTLKVISGLLKPASGTLEFDGQNLSGYGHGPDLIINLDCCMVPEKLY